MLGRCGLPAHAADFVGRLMPLLVIVAASLLVARFDLDRRHGVAGVGAIAQGLASFVGFVPGLSLATLLLRASTPHIAVIGRGAGSELFRNFERYGVETIPGVVLLRIDEGLFFGNLAAVEARLTAELEKAPGTHDLVPIMSGVNRVDTTAMEVLTDINRDLADRGVRLHLAEVKGPVQDRPIRSPLWTALSGNVHLSANSAFESLVARKSATVR